MEGTVDTLNIAIKTEGIAQATNGLKALIKTLERFKAISGQVAQTEEKTKDSTDAVSKGSETATVKVSKLRNALDSLKSAFSKSNQTIADMRQNFVPFGEGLKKLLSPLSTFISSLKRIAFYRILRSIIKGITSAIKEGISNIYYYSQITGTTFAGAMDRAKSSALTLKNSIGAALAPVIESLVPVIQKVCAWLVKMNNLIAAFFAALSGKSTYTAAVDTTVQWGDALDSASGSAAELKKQLMGFDELNVLDDPSSGGGGGGGASTPDYSNMFQEMEIPPKVKEVVEWIQEHLGLIKGIAIAIGVILLTWKLSNAFLGGVSILSSGIALLIIGIAAVAYGLYQWITTGQLTFETLMILVGGILAIGAGIAILTGSLIPLIIAGIVALGLAVYYAWDDIKAALGKAWDYIKKVATAIRDEVVGEWNAICEVFWGIDEWVYNNVILPVWNTIVWLFNTITQIVLDSIYGVLRFIASVPGWIRDKIIVPLTTWFITLWFNFRQGAIDAWNAIKSVFSKVAEFFHDIFTKAWQGIIKVFAIGGVIFVQIKNAITDAFKYVVNKVIGGLNAVIAIPFNGISSALNKIRNISILGKNPFSGLPYISVPVIPQLAEGGIVDAGQLFVANEAGAELVGNFGNKTGVMNNQQIVEAVADGVYRAVKAANGNGNTTVVEVDGKKLFEFVVDRNNSVVRRTGKTPLMV